eukprot:3941129-Rhodomonas_salina.8
MSPSSGLLFVSVITSMVPRVVAEGARRTDGRCRRWGGERGAGRAQAAVRTPRPASPCPHSTLLPPTPSRLPPAKHPAKLLQSSPVRSSSAGLCCTRLPPLLDLPSGYSFRRPAPSRPDSIPPARCPPQRSTRPI